MPSGSGDGDAATERSTAPGVIGVTRVTGGVLVTRVFFWVAYGRPVETRVIVTEAPVPPPPVPSSPFTFLSSCERALSPWK